MWIYKELGNRLGLADFFQYTDEEDYIQQQLAPMGGSIEEIKLHGYLDLPKSEQNIYEWSTPSGKIEIFSSVLESGKFDAVPKWEEPPQPKPGMFYLLTGKVGQHTQFGTQNNQMLDKYSDEPRLWMNTLAAELLGLKDWDMVEATSEVGSVRVQLKVTESIRQDCVYMAPGYGHLSKGLRTAYGKGASSSELHVTYVDPISGGQALSQTFVAVKKA